MRAAPAHLIRDRTAGPRRPARFDRAGAAIPDARLSPPCHGFEVHAFEVFKHVLELVGNEFLDIRAWSDGHRHDGQARGVTPDRRSRAVASIDERWVY